MHGPVGAVMVPPLIGAERPRVRLGETIPGAVRGLERRELRSGVGIERRPQRAGELTGAERAEHCHLGGAEGLGHALGLLHERGLAERGIGSASAYAPAVDLNRNQDLVLLRHACAVVPISSR